jgi:hypothetical protein
MMILVRVDDCADYNMRKIGSNAKSSWLGVCTSRALETIRFDRNPDGRVCDDPALGVLFVNADSGDSRTEVGTGQLRPRAVPADGY